MDEYILRFFRDEIDGGLITDAEGNTLYEDEKTAFVRQERTNWKAACPLPLIGQRVEMWDLIRSECGKTYMVITSTYEKDGKLIQIHRLVDTSVYTDLYRDLTDYSRTLREEKDHDSLTGLFNKGRFTELKRTLFQKQQTIAVFNMDVNNLKYMNDTYGHEAGDRLIKKAAASLKKIVARNVMPFRVGGDEFMLVALHVDREGAERIRADWEKALKELNQKDDGISCVIACGLAFGEQGYDLEEILALADQRMYEDKKAKKAGQSGAGRGLTDAEKIK